MSIDRRGARRDHRPLHARGGRAQPRARDRQRHPRRGGQGGVGRDLRRRASTPGRRRRVSSGRRSSSPRSPSAPRSRAWPPAWPGRRPAATSCSSRSSRMPGKGNLVLTGQLGDVMKESAQAALSYVRSHVERAGHPAPTSSRRPTCTCTCRRARCRRTARRRATPSSSAMVSLLTGRRVRGDVAMTGEITLRGTVLPVGGIKEKVLAAHRAGHQARDPARAQRQGPRRHPRESAQRARVHRSSRRSTRCWSSTLEAVPVVVPGPGAARGARKSRPAPDPRFDSAEPRAGRAVRRRPAGARPLHGEVVQIGAR